MPTDEIIPFNTLIEPFECIDLSLMVKRKKYVNRFSKSFRIVQEAEKTLLQYFKSVNLLEPEPTRPVHSNLMLSSHETKTLVQQVMARFAESLKNMEYKIENTFSEPKEEPRKVQLTNI